MCIKNDEFCIINDEFGQVLMVGDSRKDDIRSGSRAGCLSAWLCSMNPDEKELDDDGLPIEQSDPEQAPDLTIDSLNELCGLWQK